MKNRKLSAILAFSALSIVAIGGYFIASRSDILLTRQVVHTQPTTDAQQSETVEDSAQQLATSEQEETKSEQTTVDDVQESKTEELKIVEKKVEEKIVEPEKKTEPEATVGKIVDKLVSWGFTKSSGRKIDTIIVHSSYDAFGTDPYSVPGIIDEYKQYNVSAHYLIARDGVIHRLVQDKDIAWHAGVSKVPDGRTNVNDFSLGIEMINTKDGKYTGEQYAALNSLIASSKKKYEIKYILGHNEVASGRKTDPWGIDWKKVNR